MDHAPPTLPHIDAMQLFIEPKSALIAAPLKVHLERPHAQPYWCLPVNAHYTLPSFPGDIKGRLNVKVVILTSHFLDFEHLIEYPQPCLFQVACTLSEPPPLRELAVYMPLETASMRLLPSHHSRHRSLSVRSLVSCVYMRSGWSNR